VLLLAPGTALALYGNENFMWRMPSGGGPVIIPVCFENPGDAPARNRDWARQAVEASWMRFARVNFSGWGSCGDRDRGIRIQIINEGASSAPHGRELDGVRNGMRLNLHYADDAWCRASDANLERCIKSVAVHEFGHVLGFYHTEERDDYDPKNFNWLMVPEGCIKQSYPNTAPRKWGSVDLQSVMSYCGQRGGAENWRQELSPGDIAGVQTAYGRRIPGSIVTSGGRCLASKERGGDIEPAFIWLCDEANDDQEWTYRSGSLLLGARTLKFLAGPVPNGTALHAFGRTPLLGQEPSFVLERMEIRGYGGMCLDLHNGRTEDGTRIQIWRCNGSNNQKWSLTDAGEIRFGGPNSGKCATLANRSTADGTALVIASCDGSESQRFIRHTDGTLRTRVGSTTKCLDVRDVRTADFLAGRGGPNNGQVVQLFQCVPDQINQKWNLSGALRSTSSGKCLDIAQDRDGVPAQLWDCTGNAARQTWDVYFR
jgi:hypothetical protein